MAELISPQRKLTIQEIKDFESEFSSPIPEAFKNHYLRINGGFASESDIEAGAWGLPVNGLNPIKYGNMTIEKLIEDMQEISTNDARHGTWGQEQFIPFAYDSGGNTLFISLRNDDFGFIYLYAQDGHNIIKIESSFSLFLKKLYKLDY